MKIDEITESSYGRTSDLNICFASGVPTKFARIVDERFSRAVNIAWQSDLINPALVTLDRYFLVGVDVKIAVLDLESENLSLLLPLDSFFVEFNIQKDAVIVVAESEVLVLNSSSFSIRNYSFLPDIISEYIIVNREIRVKCVDDHNETICF